MSEVVLTAAQVLELELVLAGAWGDDGRLGGEGSTAGRLTLPVARAVPGIRVSLLDREGTHVGSVDVERVDDAGRVSGTASAARPFGHRDQLELRATARQARHGRAVVITGDVPSADDARWRSVDPGVVVTVLDRGDSGELARAVAAARMRTEAVAVLPAPDAGARTAQEWDAAVLSATHTLIADEVTVWRTGRRSSEGLVVLLTGLSGSGKSTIAKRLVERLGSVDPRTATLLDGDEVRQVLSAGLGFSRSDRELNVRRIGWVAALIARHGGIAVCAPIAPYASMRAEMREQVEPVGTFVLVHVATSLEVCEARDRKGLYARARRGEIPEFTGISDPYEEPIDADVRVDAGEIDVDDAVERILQAVRAAEDRSV